LAYRAFYSYPLTLTLSDGQPINAVYGFAALLMSGIEEFKPDYVSVCFDRKEPTYRHQIYKEYKAHRPPPPEEFSTQVPLLRDILEKMAIPSIDMAGYEADDLMGTLSKHAESEGLNCVIMTGDLDMLQIVSKKTHVVTSKKGEMTVYTPEKVHERFTLGPEQMIDYKALRGDSSDNIPGVKGVGEKTAIALMTQFGSLEKLYQKIEEVQSQSVQSKLTTDKEMAFLSQKLVTIDRDVPIKQTIKDFLFQPNWPDIVESFQAYNFKSLVKKYSAKSGELAIPETDASPPDGTYQLLENIDVIRGLLPLMQDGFAIDLETTGKRPVGAQIVGICISITPKKAYYIPLNTYLQTPPDQTIPLFSQLMGTLSLPFPMNPVLDLFKKVLEDPKVPKFTHHGKYEMEVFRNYGIKLKGITFDTLLAAYLLHSGDRVGLKVLTRKHENTEMLPFKDVLKQANAASFQDVPVEMACKYGAADADYTLRLKVLFEPEIKEKFAHIFKDMEMPLQEVLADMEYTGVTINRDHLIKMGETFGKEIRIIEADVHKMVGKSFNLASPKQLGEILFDQLKLPVTKKTKTGYSTDSSVLEKLVDSHPIAKALLRYRLLTKLSNTYINALPSLVNPLTNRIHTSFNQAGTATGRLSSTDPNLQNIPIRSEDGQKIRHAFIPSTMDGWILSADYSQIELRVIAHLTQDAGLLKAFKNGEDIHKSTAALVFHVPYKSVTKDQRNVAKTVNFGITYGQSAFALSEQLKIDRSEAQDIIDRYFEKFPAIREFIADTEKMLYADHFVETAFGRIRQIPEVRSTNRQQQNFARRMAVNTRVQGTAADIMKMAMIKVYNAMKKEKLASKMIIQVHDELVFDVVKGEKERLEKLVRTSMEEAVEFTVPLSVDMAFGKNWAET